RMKPEDVLTEMNKLSADRPFRVVLCDTLAAWFDGKDINDNVQGGEFMRRVRSLTSLRGSPSVIVAAHPTKNASADQLVPYGSGAILNEIDGNLTMWKDNGIAYLHWQGKLRGLEFERVPFKFETIGSPDVLDSVGRQVQIPVCVPTSQEVIEE